MTKSEMIALLFLCKSDLSHLETLNDYIDQFDEIARQVQGIIENKETSNS